MTDSVPYYCEDTTHGGRGCSNRARFVLDGKYYCRVHYNMRADVLSIFSDTHTDHIPVQPRRVSDWQLRKIREGK